MFLDDLKEFFIVFFMCLLFLVALIFIIALCVTPFAIKDCNNSYKDARYDFFAGCMVKYEGEYIPEELYIKAFEQNIKVK